MKKIFLVLGILMVSIISMSFVKSEEEDLATIIAEDGTTTIVNLNDFLNGIESGNNFELPTITREGNDNNNWNYTSMVTTYCPGSGVSCRVTLACPNGVHNHTYTWEKGKNRENTESKPMQGYAVSTVVYDVK